MKKLLLYLFLITAGLISTVQVSAQKEIAPGVIKLQKGEIDTFMRTATSPAGFALFPVWWQACHRSNEGTSCSQVAF